MDVHAARQPYGHRAAEDILERTGIRAYRYGPNDATTKERAILGAEPLGGSEARGDQEIVQAVAAALRYKSTFARIDPSDN